MELSIYDIIKRPTLTDKSINLYKKLGQYTFEVHQDANKGTIRNAIEKLWNVKVDKVRLIRIKGKSKSFNHKEFIQPSRKKAIVTLKKGYKIEIPGTFESMTQEHPASAKSVAEGS
jgi:large subunit ribosomal protein L23